MPSLNIHNMHGSKVLLLRKCSWLFLLYINDVTDVFNHDCKCKLYADDIKIYWKIQQDLWLKSWCFSTKQPQVRVQVQDCYRNARPSVLCVYHTRELCLNSWTGSRCRFAMHGSWPWPIQCYIVLDGDPTCIPRPQGRGNFGGEDLAHCEVWA